MTKLLLLDGHSLAYRAFYALPTDLATRAGTVSNAVYGFTSMLVKVLADEQPDHIAVAFDTAAPTFRDEMDPEYKAGRKETPTVFSSQLPLIREVLDALKIQVLEEEGVEADDVIATLAVQAAADGMDVVVVTGDRDTYQLVQDPHVKVLYNRRGVSDYVLYDEAGIAERTGVPPRLYVPYAALRGDPSDNLPGVPGVGEKTAARLITKYDGLDGLFEHVDEQTPKLRTNLAEHEAQARLNAEVMVLVRDAPVPVTIDDLVRQPHDLDELQRLFDFLEFHSLTDRLGEALGEDGGDIVGPATEVLEAEVAEITSVETAVALLDDLRTGAGTADTGPDGRPVPVAIAAAWEGSEGRSPLEGLAFMADPASAEVAWVPAALLDESPVRQALRELLAPVDAGGRSVATHQAKALMRSLLELPDGVDVQCLALDTAIAAYLLDPAESRYLLDEILRRYAQAELPQEGAASEGQLDLDGTGVTPALQTARHALAVHRLIAPLSQALHDRALSELYDTIEVPLVRVLARMEAVGVGVDADELRRLRDQLNSQVESYRAQIYEDAGTEFNVNSTPQMREILFDKLGLTPQKKTKTGYSTDAASLERLAGQHPIIEHLLAYREVEKLRSTYGDGLLAKVAPDGRIHAMFNQTVARTGRLSSDQPNLHNIPVRSEIGREFRKAFVPAAGFALLVADYNQIELRCIAHLADDPGLVAAFTSGRDIHTETASRIFGVEPGHVTIEQRSKAKMVSYGLAYGMEAYGLGQRLNIATEEAALILAAYFEAFPAVKDYMERTGAEARERGYTETLFGRRRQIPQLSSPNYRIRQAGERQAMNAGIQGLAADIFKVALVRIEAALEAAGMDSRLILQVHDEVLLDVPPAEHDVATDVVVEAMRGAAELNVPPQVNLAFGPSWADAKG